MERSEEGLISPGKDHLRAAESGKRRGSSLGWGNGKVLFEQTVVFKWVRTLGGTSEERSVLLLDGGARKGN